MSSGSVKEMLTRISYRATLANMKISIPAKESGSRIVSVRFKPSEYTMLKTQADRSGVPVATMLRAIGIQIGKREIQVN